MKPSGTEINLLFLTTACQKCKWVSHSFTWPELRIHRSNINFYGVNFEDESKCKSRGMKRKEEWGHEPLTTPRGDDRWRQICIRRAKGESPDSFENLSCLCTNKYFSLSLLLLFSPSNLTSFPSTTNQTVSSQFLFVCCLRLSFFCVSSAVSASVHFRIKRLKLLCVWVCFLFEDE